ncbi:MAG: hypothetical protein RL513_560 [Pseudomonadota bacterium]
MSMPVPVPVPVPAAAVGIGGRVFAGAPPGQPGCFVGARAGTIDAWAFVGYRQRLSCVPLVRNFSASTLFWSFRPC